MMQQMLLTSNVRARTESLNLSHGMSSTSKKPFLCSSIATASWKPYTQRGIFRARGRILTHSCIVYLGPNLYMKPLAAGVFVISRSCCSSSINSRPSLTQSVAVHARAKLGDFFRLGSITTRSRWRWPRSRFTSPASDSVSWAKEKGKM